MLHVAVVSEEEKTLDARRSRCLLPRVERVVIALPSDGSRAVSIDGAAISAIGRHDHAGE